MRIVIAAAVGMLAAGPIGAVGGGLGVLTWDWSGRFRNRPQPPPLRLVLILVLVELRSGQSVLGALQGAAHALPEHQGLTRVSRVAAVSGLTTALNHAPEDLRPVVAQLARAQSSGASLVGTVRRLLEEDLRNERARRLARTRSLPTRLMVPVTLLMLPGILLFAYGPSLVNLYQELFTTWP